MKIISHLIAMAAIAVAVSAHAAGANTAAQAWQSVTNFAPSPPPTSWTTNPPTQIQIDQFNEQRARELMALAEKARNFYLHFPADTNALSSRVLELQALQMAARIGTATNRVNDLVARERALSQDTNAPMELRYEVRLDLLGRELKGRIDAGADPNMELEKLGRTMIKEFPAGPAGYELLSQVAESADLAKMKELGDVMAKSGGPQGLTEMGQGLLRRLAVVGKPFPIAFKTEAGREIDATTFSNKVVLVDFWAIWCPVCVQETPRIKAMYDKYHTNGLEVVGINFDDETNQAQQFIKDQELPWPQYFGGRANPYGREYALNFLPQAWLVDRHGVVQDIHSRVDLEAKIEKLLAK